MDCLKGDIEVVFSILDADRSGEVSFEEFAAELHRMKSNDPNTMLHFIKHYVKSMRDEVLTDMRGVLECEFGYLKEQVMETKGEVIRNREEAQHQNSQTRPALAHS